VLALAAGPLCNFRLHEAALMLGYVLALSRKATRRVSLGFEPSGCDRATWNDDVRIC